VKVKLIQTGEVTVVNDSYGKRLIEQGKAVPAPVEKKAATAKPRGGNGAESTPVGEAG
jgi:hypothetical protein